ncbi:MAG: isopentenyl-diphosphate Delta-isomerase [Patescibacteria group bacterium]|nr:isopentenyl-diphosphate Delta-isomerase [Patescibacteria group bacterium]
MEQVVLVDKDDKEIGLEEKEKAHLGEGKLHRAFSIFIFNPKKELLITKRSSQKMLWPLFWDSACASHPLKGESQEKAGERRLKEELGFTCKLKEVDRFEYHALYEDIGSEYEICSVLIGFYDRNININPDEVAEYKWVDLKWINQEISSNKDKYTPWLIIAIERLKKKNYEFVEKN